METDQLDRALIVFAATAPEFGRFGLSNHGPMAAEVLERFGRADAIGDWVAAYRENLDPAPPPADKPLGEDAWPVALGTGDDTAAAVPECRAPSMRAPHTAKVATRTTPSATQAAR